MTDEQKLRSAIADSGFKLRFLAKKMGISYQGLLKKMRNESAFRASEIQILSDLLHLQGTQRDSIFFASDVGK